MKFLIFGLLALALVAIAVLLIMSNQFVAKIEALRKIVVAAQTSPPPEENTIPEIIRTFAVRNGATLGGPATVISQQQDEMTSGPGQPYFALQATQLSGTRKPGFVWEATATMALVVPIRVVDALAADDGLLEVRIAGAIPMVNAAGPDSDKGEMMRFLSELAWNPDAILNVAALKWRQIDERTVEVSIETAGGIAAVRHLFDANGDIVGIEADDRPYLLDGKTVPMRWIGRFRDYTQFGSYRVPRHGEVAWVLPEGEFVYFRGTITSFAAVE
ncbi:DUF6544 family protein [Devosia sp. SL43]|uniref:DUF6544 family protein n=1 Tax=Devosia sp. SL43 TaxID=2806348 RepID=UPI001F3915DF|nr:DUF6544 family protein [Devosia sp. SL43]UJW85691.1 hypothetical protein IM737_20290 [Devosia sp. SL43]